MKPIVFICLTVLFNSYVKADEKQESRVERYVKNGISQLEETIEESRKALKGKLSSDRRERLSQQKFHRKRISQLENQRKDHTYTVSLPRSRPLKVGDIGQLISNRMVVFQVIDKSNLLAKVEWYEWKLKRVGNTVDRELVNHEDMVWISGLDTSQIVDNRLFKTERVFEVIGNKTYQTSTGTKTVMSLELCDGIEEQAKAFGATNYPIETTKTTTAKPKLPNGFRTWVSADGKFKMVGKFISGDSSQIVLEKEDGSRVKVPLSALREIDRNIVSKELNKSNK